jgi:hypothetical protein
MIPYLETKTKTNRTRDVAQMVACLPSKTEAANSIPNITKKKERKKEKNMKETGIKK